MFMKVKDFQTVASGGRKLSKLGGGVAGQWTVETEAEGERTVRAEQQHAGRGGLA